MNLPKLRKVDPNQPTKKKILLLCDDLRMHSGIATMAREFVVGTAHEFDWVQLGGAIKHPEKGKVVDISQDVNRERNITDASVKIYPIDGYGSQELVRELVVRERPDAILHFTDPRFWGWLYQMEHELRQHLPIVYYNIWDDLPDPEWNKPFYESCDMLLGISKQTYGINKRLLPDYEDWQVQYLPHGVNDREFYPIREGHKEYDVLQEYRKQKGFDQFDFVLALTNRNIRRKNLNDVILSYKRFCDTLTPEKAEKCLLILHTAAIDNNGTDLIATVKTLCPQYNVWFTNGHMETSDLNKYYNSADVVINIASNEGFGLGTCESLMAGTPIIVNVTGGLQDQCGFTLNGKHIGADAYPEIGSLHDIAGAVQGISYGKWVEPVWPSSISLKGSVPTPFIFDDTANLYDIVEAIGVWYNRTPQERKAAGMEGHQFVMSDVSEMSSTAMSAGFLKNLNILFDKWKPKQRFGLYATDTASVKHKIKHINPRFEQPKVEQKKLKLPTLKKIK